MIILIQAIVQVLIKVLDQVHVEDMDQALNNPKKLKNFLKLI